MLYQYEYLNNFVCFVNFSNCMYCTNLNISISRIYYNKQGDSFKNVYSLLWKLITYFLQWHKILKKFKTFRNNQCRQLIVQYSIIYKII